jgi:hypothetical protein
VNGNFPFTATARSFGSAEVTGPARHLKRLPVDSG